MKYIHTYIYTYGSNAGPASAVGNAKRFVQVQVAYVSANDARGRQRDLSVHIRTIHIHLHTYIQLL